MRHLTTGFVLLILAGAVFAFLGLRQLKVIPNTQNPSTDTTQVTPDNSNNEDITIVAEGLDTPWAIAFLPNKDMLVTERAGRVRLIKEGKLQVEPVATLASVKEIGEGGLLGMALHPNFSSNDFIYFYYTYSESNGNTLNRVVRMVYKDGKLADEKIIVDKIPGASNHNGGRIKFGPDGYLYITTGDASEPSLAQDPNSLAGKILRVVNDTQVSVYSFGHRNPQGLAWHAKISLWSTEHGPSGGALGVGNDELNKITISKNYGWPEIQGDQTKAGMERPIKHSGTTDIWAPAGMAFVNNRLFFGGLRGQALYEAVIQEGEKITEFKEHFKGDYSRIREVILGPDNMLYITTSNRDGRGAPTLTDDRVIKINPEKI